MAKQTEKARTVINLAGVILAGGLSRRMEGPEKSLLELAGTPLVERVRDRLSQQVDTVILNANGDPERFNFLGINIVADTIEGFAGPLAGVLSGMRWAQKQDGIEWIITAAADTPFFPENYTEKLLQASNGKKVVLASSNSRRHPVFGLWHISLADDLEKFLLAGDRKVMLFVQNYENALVEFEGHGDDPFFNVNTPQDWEKAEKRALELLNDD